MSTAQRGFATPAEIYGALKRAGADDNLAQTLTAISKAESSGYTGALGNYQGNQFQGLFQIGSFWSRDPRLTSDDIDYQAQQAMMIYGKQGLAAWETYTNGMYQKWMSESSPSQAGMNSLGAVLGAGVGGSFDQSSGGLTSNSGWEDSVAQAGAGAATGVGVSSSVGIEEMERLRANSTFLAQNKSPLESGNATTLGNAHPEPRPDDRQSIQNGQAYEDQFIPETEE